MDKIEPHTSEQSDRFMKLYMAVQRRLYGYVISLLPESDAAEDVIQETVTYMWKQFGSFEPGTDFVRWSFCIARNKVFDHIKRQQRHKRYFSRQTIEAIEETVAQKAMNEDRRFDALRKCIDKLSINDQQLLVLRYEDAATLQSVSLRVGQSVHTLYSRLYKIRISLLNCIERKLTQETY